MITVSDCQQLINKWEERLQSPLHSFDYRNALSECIDELNHLIGHSIEEELSYQDYLDMEADSYLSAMKDYEEIA